MRFRRYLLLSAACLAAALSASAEERFECAGFSTTEAITSSQSPVPIRKTHFAAKPAQPGGVTRSAVVLFANFLGEATEETAVPDWAAAIFDPDLPGSFSHFYDTMSVGKLKVRGQVAPQWYESEQADGFYLAQDHTEEGRYGAFVIEVLRKADREVDFSRYDNDGPDGVPNSGDDDGVVDVVFINTASTPPNFLLGSATEANRLGFRTAFETDDPAASGGVIGIDPRSGTVQRSRFFTEAVGAMCHEYGHVLGLPDLFNTSFLRSEEPLGPEADSAGIGRWGLMGWGALGWRGDDGPVTLSGWSRAKLGWTEVVEMSSARQEIALR